MREGLCLSALGRSTGGWAAFPVFLATLLTPEQAHCWPLAATEASPGQLELMESKRKETERKREREMPKYIWSKELERIQYVCVTT